ncbi:response regulator [Noviherbaspirillum sp. CPCC 100848]|uniref:Response regulator n=1 Tax=Noviherbaspirillum album TaxID=3080276 RepID=A0ABU6JIE6_9BURK|nr:response regulator [Noviherbaspirillum sp. CPCC 100848]MEC4723183.1 response regulator [Noviherbaspirillum sp. CPCC 100848]
MRIFLVEDDAMIGDSIRTALIRENYIVDWVRDGKMVETALSTEHFDVVLLDLGLPGKSGLEILRNLRMKKNSVPVIIVTARDAVDDRIRGLDAGADDYVIKPFDMNELGARIRSAMRRSSGRAEPDITIGGITLSPASREIWRDDEQIHLSGKEYAIVEALMLRPGNILSKAQLEERINGWGDEVESNALEVHIHSIRRKLGSEFIRNVRGVGYFIPRAKCTA